MASDRKQFARAMDRWEGLWEKRRFSVSPKIGTTAVFHSYWPIDSHTAASNKEREIFADEAMTIARLLELKGYDSEVIHGITAEGLDNVLTDPIVSDVVLIGHGNLSNVFLDNGEKYDWRRVSQTADHLKMGDFVQRFCGNNMRMMSVPLGTFAVSKHFNVYAAVGTSFEPEKDMAHELRMRRVTDEGTLSYGAIKHAFPRQIFADDTEEDEE